MSICQTLYRAFADCLGSVAHAISPRNFNTLNNPINDVVNRVATNRFSSGSSASDATPSPKSRGSVEEEVKETPVLAISV